MKRLLAALAALPLLLSLFACQGGPKPLDLSYETPDGKKVAVRQVEPTKEKPMAHYNWVDPGQEQIYDLADIVAKGKISNIREIEMTFNTPGGDDVQIEHATLLDFVIDEVYKGEAKGDRTITVFHSIASRNFPFADEGGRYEIKELVDKAEYYVFLKSASSAGYSEAGLHLLADYVIFYPQSFLIPEDSAEEYLKRKFEVYQSEKNSNGTVEKYADMDSFTIREYENFLKEYFK